MGTRAEHEHLANLARQGRLEEANKLALQLIRREHLLGKNSVVRSPITTKILQLISERSGVASICGECGSEISRLSLFPASRLMAERSEIAYRIVDRGHDLNSEWYRNLRETHSHADVAKIIEQCIIEAVGEQPGFTVETVELTTIGDYRRALEALVEGDQFPPPVITAEDGIVYVGGGAYWPGIVLGIRLLRKRGCTLPIQVWHRGDEEPVRPEQVARMDVTIVDTVQHANARGGARRLGGWEAKLWALSHCGFRRVLYLDADAYCVEDPQPLFDLLSRSEPFLFWHDLLGREDKGRYKPSTEKHVKWSMVWSGGASGVPPIQGGQLMIDLERFWKPLIISHWMNQHSDYYYSHMFGDQDTWRVACAALSPGHEPLATNTTNESLCQSGDLWRCLGPCPWDSPAFVIPFDGKPMIVHRCQGKLFPVNQIPDSQKGRPQFLTPRYHLPCESEVFTELTEIIDDRNCSAVFSEVYRKKVWGAESGAGSSDREMRPWTDWLIIFMREHGLQTIVELGCGSAKLARMYGKSYTGIDCVESILDVARKHKQSTFIKADFFGERHVIPDADVLILKDVLHHFPNAMIHDFLKWLTVNRRRWKQIIICGDCNQMSDGADCPLGAYRALSVSMRPLSDFEPIEVYRYLHKAIVTLPETVSTAVRSLWGVGDHLEHLIGRLLRVRGNSSCSCETLRRQMNEWGPEGCVKNHDEIVAQILQNRQSLNFATYVPDRIASKAISLLVTKSIHRTKLDIERRPNKTEDSLSTPK